MRFVVAAFLLASLGLASQSMAQVSKSGKGYLFRVKYTKGQVLKFKIDSTVKGLGSDPKGITVSIPSAMRVLSVKGGVANMQVAMGKPMSGGQPLPISDQNATVSLDTRNTPVDGGIVAGNMAAEYPQASQKIGSTWKAEVPVAIGPSRQQTSLDTFYKFAGFKSVKGMKMAIITLKISGTAIGTGALLVKVSDGTLYSSEMNLKLTVKGYPDMPVAIKVRRL